MRSFLDAHNKHVVARAFALLALGAAAAMACSASSGTGGSAANGATSSGGSSTGGSSGFGGVATGGNGGTQINTDSGSGGSSGVPIGDGGECKGISEVAENKPAPVDVIWAVDTSDSMVLELQAVEQHLNNFHGVVNGGGIDMHVVIVGRLGTPNGGTPFNPDPGFCISPPLGIGGCPNQDSNPPLFVHLNQGVGSNNALSQFIAQYPNYKANLRQNSVKYFAVVTDDESDMSAADFTAAVDALDPGWFNNWKFFGVFCTGNCGTFLACAATGNVYNQLVQQKAGLSGDLCGAQQDFGPVFQALAQTIITGKALSCEWAIPPAPPGETFEAGKVNVKYSPMDGNPPQDILKVKSAADCGPQGGWYYDNDANPTKIIVCPANCDSMSKNINGAVDIIFGCQTVSVPR
jgi:hypothetical protein